MKYKKFMQHLLFFPILFLSLSGGSSSNLRIADPAAVYCKFLGYNIEMRKDLKGNEYGVCLFPNGTECAELNFFRGICGKEFSYCSKKGCETYSITDDKGSFRIVYCACRCKDSLGNMKTIPLMEFMEQNGDTLMKSRPGRKGGAF